jgi:hypothetical protein
MNYRVVFPPGVLEALKRGELHLLESKGGLGFLPLIADDNHIVKQVRIVPDRLDALDREVLRSAVGQAITHALLREVLRVLHTIEKKTSRQTSFTESRMCGSLRPRC